MAIKECEKLEAFISIGLALKIFKLAVYLTSMIATDVDLEEVNMIMSYSRKRKSVFVYMHEQTVSCLETEQMLNEDQMTDDNK